METTNVTAVEVNYHHYPSEQYNRDIRNAIPFHGDIHAKVMEFISKRWDSNGPFHVLDLGVGTGLTSRVVLDLLPKAKLTVVDFSEHMMAGARQTLGQERVKYVIADYSEMDFGVGKFDLVVSVIGLHHQTDVGKILMFNKIKRALVPMGGAFIFGDLVTFRDPQTAALEAARHYHHLVEKAADEQTLTEWAHHHMFLNQLAPLEDQVDWLESAGFAKVEVLFQKFQTALIVAQL